jgi:hypothetical protein
MANVCSGTLQLPARPRCTALSSMKPGAPCAHCHVKQTLQRHTIILLIQCTLVLAASRRTLLYALPSSAVNTMEPTMVAPMQMTATGPNCGLSMITTARLFCSGRFGYLLKPQWYNISSSGR